MAELTAIAPAKVNLYLEVGGIRPDGYHEVKTIVQAIELHDTVKLTSAERLEVAMSPDIGIPAEENIVYKAAVAYAHAASVSPDVRIEIEKAIPSGAGLGGGSSDAAATLLALSVLWDSPVGEADLWSIASGLGADVPFFLQGGTALLTGKGDVLDRSLPTPALDIALIKPHRSVSTAEAYRLFTDVGAQSSADAGSMLAALSGQDPAMIASALRNDLTGAASILAEEIPRILDFCATSEGVLGCLMSGSGSAVFAICEDARSATSICNAAESNGWWSQATSTLSTGAKVSVARERP